jgi:inhibitor of KinA sporulation pathway (predicted exonuclease)
MEREIQPRHYLVIDLEATCDQPASFPRSECEIIEIGAVVVEARQLQPVDEFQTFIRPVRHPRLTAFCTELTSITQADVDSAPTFPQAVGALGAFLADYRPLLFCSWGAYDRNQLRHDAAHHRVRLPLGSDHLNLKQAFSDRLGTRKRFGMRGALRRAGLPLEGTHHRGIDDARNIAKLLPWCLGRRVP